MNYKDQWDKLKAFVRCDAFEARRKAKSAKQLAWLDGQHDATMEMIGDLYDREGASYEAVLQMMNSMEAEEGKK